jgi:hypothetical protein
MLPLGTCPAMVTGGDLFPPPPPPYDPTHLSSFQLSRYILRMASNLEVVSTTADIGQQQ